MLLMVLCGGIFSESGFGSFLYHYMTIYVVPPQDSIQFFSIHFYNCLKLLGKTIWRFELEYLQYGNTSQLFFIHSSQRGVLELIPGDFYDR